MEIVRKLKQCLVQEKHGSSSQKKANAKGKETKMKTLSVPTLVEKRHRSCSLMQLQRETKSMKNNRSSLLTEQHLETEVRPCPIAGTLKKTQQP